MAMQRLLTSSVMNIGSVSVDSDVKAPNDLLRLRVLTPGTYGGEKKKPHYTENCCPTVASLASCAECILCRVWRLKAVYICLLEEESSS